MTMKAVVIEDDKNIVDVVNLAFEFRWPDARLLSASDGKEGIALVNNESPDVVILDINLPDINGFTVLREIRKFSAVPVIILTVRSDDEDMVQGLELGADDYVIKPFNYVTLLARIKAVLRRSEKSSLSESSNTAFGSRLKIDFVGQKVWVDDRPVKLTPTEYRLLVFLVKNNNQVVTHQRIIHELWVDSPGDSTENLWIHIRRLRKKLHDSPPEMILNKHGAGYMFTSK
jgi:DNA-binding response OmpR family regulator